MADQNSAQERTEQPTERRKQEARKKGQVPRSKELNTLLSLVIAAVGLLFLGAQAVSQFSQLFAQALSFGHAQAFDKAAITTSFVDMLLSSISLLVPFFVISLIAAMVGPMLMGGWAFSFSAVAFKLEKISPLAGAKRVFSAKGLLELVKALIKFFLLSAAATALFYAQMDEILLLSHQASYVSAFQQSAATLTWGLLLLSLPLALIALFDVPFELWNHNRQLKMTKREVMDELKETEGRPEVKGKIRNLQREMSQRRMMDAVPEADVVITNPQHFAVALKYDDEATGAPRVVAKGADLVAQRIRELARDNAVAIYQAPPLARALYASTEVGEEIPQNLYLAVAKVLAYVYQLSAAAWGEKPEPPTDIVIPEEYRGLYE